MEMACNSMEKILDEQPSTSYVLCPICSMKFDSTQLLSAHKKQHNIAAASKRVCRLVCPLCEERKEFRRHQMLRIHLKEKHGIDIELIVLEFSSIQEYNIWFEEQRIEANYVKRATIYCKKEEYKEITYSCNRSYYQEYTSKLTKMTEKYGGAIKINGMCPSRLICIFYNKGNVSVSFWKTHVGHENELRCQRLTTSEKNVIVDKLKCGVPIDKILKDARQINIPEVQRINILNRKDIYYLTKKHNINKVRHPNEMTAVHLKGNEWNANGKSCDCPEFTVENTLCKYENRMGTNCVQDDMAANSVIKSENKKEISQILLAKQEDVTTPQLNEEMKKTLWDNLANVVFALNPDKFIPLINKYYEMAKQVSENEPANKRKIEKHTYFPTNKRKKE